MRPTLKAPFLTGLIVALLIVWTVGLYTLRWLNTASDPVSRAIVGLALGL